MTGMMNEQMKKGPKLSAEQQRNLDAFDMGGNSMKAQEIETSPSANNVPNFSAGRLNGGTHDEHGAVRGQT